MCLNVSVRARVCFNISIYLSKCSLNHVVEVPNVDACSQENMKTSDSSKVDISGPHDVFIQHTNQNFKTFFV